MKNTSTDLRMSKIGILKTRDFFPNFKISKSDFSDFHFQISKSENLTGFQKINPLLNFEEKGFRNEL
jgi:hypothetical protein